MVRLRTLTVALMLFWGLAAQAAHLVGGELTYTCLGNNQYQIKLVVYRDCNSTGAQLDPTVSIGIYDGIQNLLIHNLQVNKGPTINVPANTGNPCLQAPPNICTEYATYTTVIQLPQRTNGYVITWQRCCRNATISNIPTPDDWGSTLMARVPPMDQCNNSPQWNSLPPIVLCNQENLQIPSTATDPDGDSLYYRLVNPLHGGGKNNGTGFNTPAPSPPAPPPYVPINFLNPSTPANPIPGTPALSIGGTTGLLTGFLNVTGQFVLAIEVEEWRSGALLNTARRDYQFNVTSCQAFIKADIVSEVDDPEQICIGATVPFFHESINASTFWWDFGDLSRSDDTSRLAFPTWTFSDTGVYWVTLVANPGWPCADTDRVKFHIYPPINPSFTHDGGPCFDQQPVTFTAFGTWFDGAQFDWTFGAPGDASLANWSGEFPPPIQFLQPGTYPVTLRIQSKSCDETYLDSVVVDPRPRLDSTIGPWVGCEPYTLVFDAGAFARRTTYFEWDFGDGSGDTLESPVHTYTVPGLYDVRVRMWTETGCRDTVEKIFPGAIRVNPRPVLGMTIAPKTVSIYQPLVQVRADSVDADEQFWFDMGDSSLYAQEAFVVHLYRDTGTFVVRRIAVNQFGCWDTLVDSVRVNPIYNVWSPTAFTPNGDGGNEGFRPVATGITQYRLHIMDRWGNVVFRSEDALEEWNGRVHNVGAECPEGAYVWSLFTLDFGDSPVEQQGVVLLVR